MTKTATWRNTPFAKRFYRSREWQMARELVLARSQGLCERCMEDGRLTPADVVHHRIPLSPENMADTRITLGPDNLMALCDECHTAVHQELGVGAMNGRKEEKPRVGFDKDGNVVRL